MLFVYMAKHFSVGGSPIRITEVCAKNISAAYDDNGNYGADYIELYNSSDEPVNLKGWFLSDNSKNLEKFVFPEYVLAPGSTVMVWCSPNIDDVSLYKSDFVPVDIHDVPFGIKLGEAVILSSPDKKTTVSVALPNDIPDNMTYSSSLENLKRFFVCSATPYAVPEKPLIDRSKKLEAPTYSIKGGWYDSNVVVTLSASEGDIYYTLDGSVPDETSLKYEGPITITNRTSEPNIYSNMEGTATANTYLPDFPVDKGTALKAIAISPKGKSNVETETYFVSLDPYGYNNMPIISLSMDPDDLFGYEKGIYCMGKVMDLQVAKVDLDPSDLVYEYPNYAKEGRGWERPAKLEYISPDHQKVFEQNIGVRIHGGWSVAENQKSFNLYARPEYDNNSTFAYDFFGSGTKLPNKVMLRSGGSRDLFITKMRDVFCQSLVSDRNVGIQTGFPCEVFLNGEYWGMYVLQEAMNETYVSEHYGVSPENVLIIKNTEDIYDASTDNPEDVKLYTDILDFASKNDLSLPENYKWISDRIDIQSFIDYFITEIYVANGDAFTNNLAIWRTINPEVGKYSDGKWRWLVYDLDESAGIISEMNNPSVDSFVDGHWRDSHPLTSDVLFTSLLNNEDFKKQFVTTFMDMTNHNFSPDIVIPKLDSDSEKFKEGDVKSHERFRGPYIVSGYDENEEFNAPYSEEDFAVDIGVISDFFKKRPEYMTKYLKDDLKLTGTLNKLSVSCDNTSSYEIKVNTLSLSNLSNSWEGNYYTDYPVHLSYTSDSAKFVGWEINGKIVSSSPDYDVTLSGTNTTVRAITEK